MKKRRIFAIVVAVIVLLGAGIFIYAGDYYHADEWAVQVMEDTDGSVKITENGGRIAFIPEDPGESKAGLIFYPGGKVQAEAYTPLMKELAEDGFLCVLVRMPLNLAIFGVNSADGIQEEYPDVEEWYMGGHSLGGAMAASYVGRHSEDYRGLILLAAYSTSDLTDTGLDVLSVYGSEDQVLNRESYEKNRRNLPDTAMEQVIEGGCHGYFGSYGMQEGDGIPRITCEEQIEETVQIIHEYRTA